MISEKTVLSKKTQFLKVPFNKTGDIETYKYKIIDSSYNEFKNLA